MAATILERFLVKYREGEFPEEELARLGLKTKIDYRLLGDHRPEGRVKSRRKKPARTKNYVIAWKEG